MIHHALCNNGHCVGQYAFQLTSGQASFKLSKTDHCVIVAFVQLISWAQILSVSAAGQACYWWREHCSLITRCLVISNQAGTVHMVLVQIIVQWLCLLTVHCSLFKKVVGCPILNCSFCRKMIKTKLNALGSICALNSASRGKNWIRLFLLYLSSENLFSHQVIFFQSSVDFFLCHAAKILQYYLYCNISCYYCRKHSLIIC